MNTPAGLVINLGGKTVYHLGDTGAVLRSPAGEGARPHRRGADVIGGHYTMDRHDAVTAPSWSAPTPVIPCHYNTFPPIETDAQAFKSDVESKTSSKVVILEPGETHSV